MSVLQTTSTQTLSAKIEASKVSTPLMTAEEFAESRTSRHAELVRGRVLEMPPPKPRHGFVTTEIVFLLRLWARDAGFLVSDESGIRTTSRPDSVRGPDCYAIRSDRVPSVDEYFDVAPELCVEVRSKNDSMTSLAAKADEYIAAGVRVVWLVDPFAETVEVRTGDESHVFGVGDDLPPSESLPGLSIAVDQIFSQLSPNGGAASD